MKIERKLFIRFTEFEYFETYINAIDFDYDSEGVILKRWQHKLITLQFIKVNRSQYGKGTVFKQDIVEDTGNNCKIPKSGNCFIICFQYPTGIG